MRKDAESKPSVLIVGAGPTGLVLALNLHRRGAAFRIVDQHDGPGEASRALIVQARTLEFYAQLGLAARAIDAGTKVEQVRLREHGEDVATIPLHEMGKGLSPYPFALCLPQDEHERLLAAALAEEGVNIEWGTRLDSLEVSPGGAKATLVRGEGEERADFAYVAGCDGARSKVRESIGVRMGGGEYNRLYYVADVKATRPPGADLVVAMDRGDFALMLPSRKGENERLVGFVPEGREQDTVFEDVRAAVQRLQGIEVSEVNWFSTYRVHHRVASRFRHECAFLLGDAGHLHSPVGGQGMNTGIGDAVNLGWKLAQVVTGRAAATLLDSYEPERIEFARSLVQTTDRVFQIITNEGKGGQVFRTWVAPHILPGIARFEAGRHAIFRLISQIQIAYHESPLSEGKAGIRSGDRLPWVEAGDADNFASLRSLDWQVHVYGRPSPELVTLCRERKLDLISMPWSAAAEGAGLEKDAIYLVRPDGHVALAALHEGARRVSEYADRAGLQFAGGGTNTSRG